MNGFTIKKLRNKYKEQTEIVRDLKLTTERQTKYIKKLEKDIQDISILLDEALKRTN